MLDFIHVFLEHSEHCFINIHYPPLDKTRAPRRLRPEEVKEARPYRQDLRAPRLQALGRRDRHERNAQAGQDNPARRTRLGRVQARPCWVRRQQTADPSRG